MLEPSKCNQPGPLHSQILRGKHLVIKENEVNELYGLERRSSYPKTLVLGAPEKMVLEVKSRLEEWPTKGMISMKEVRSTIRKLSWLAGAVPRMRWAVSMLFGALAAAEREEVQGEEHRRALKRADQQDRPHLGETLWSFDAMADGTAEAPSTADDQKLVLPRPTMGVDHGRLPAGVRSSLSLSQDRCQAQ